MFGISVKPPTALGPGLGWFRPATVPH